jgi:nucleoside-diphosphate-sugar epimerase
MFVSDNNSNICLLTGVNGFIGHNVARKLLEQGWQVIAVGRSSSAFMSHDRLQYMKAELHDANALQALFKAYQPSHLIHLAWEATPGKFWHSEDNFQWIASSAELLRQFIAQGGTKAVLAGSCAEYKWENHILEEDSSPLSATTYYSASKLAFKDLAEVIAKDIELVWARIFFPYGSDEAESKLISYIFHEVSHGRKPVFQNPDRAVDFIHVKDVARILEALLRTDKIGTFNICSGEAILPGEIANLVAEILNDNDSTQQLPERYKPIEIKSRIQGSTLKLNEVIDMASLISFRDGLKTYMD